MKLTVKAHKFSKAAEDKITYLTRVYAVLSGINTLIVRERNRDELFREACRIAVEDGGFRLAWVGLADREARQLVPVASVGDDVGLLPDLAKNFSLEESESVRSTLAIRALRRARLDGDVRAA